MTPVWRVRNGVRFTGVVPWAGLVLGMTYDEITHHTGATASIIGHTTQELHRWVKRQTYRQTSRETDKQIRGKQKDRMII